MSISTPCQNKYSYTYVIYNIHSQKYLTNHPNTYLCVWIVYFRAKTNNILYGRTNKHHLLVLFGGILLTLAIHVYEFIYLYHGNHDDGHHHPNIHRGNNPLSAIFHLKTMIWNVEATIWMIMTLMRFISSKMVLW